jgi:hypothetical protein
MRLLVTATLVLFLAVLFSATENRAASSVLVALGEKYLDDDDWPDADEQGEIGLIMSFGQREWPVLVAVDLLFSLDEVDVGPGVAALDEWTAEIDLGVRKDWPRGRMRPFIGGGLGIIGGSRELFAFPGVVASNDDSAPGLWIDGGVVWRLGKRFELGFEGRFSSAEIELEEDVEAGGAHLLVLFGWASPGQNPPEPPPPDSSSSDAR